MTEDRELRELNDLARTAERLAHPLPAAEVRRLATWRRRRRVAVTTAVAAAAIALGGAGALSQGGLTLVRPPDPAGSPAQTAGPTPAADPTGRPGPGQPQSANRRLTTANLLKSADVPRYGSQRVGVAEAGAGRSAAEISWCFPERGLAKLDTSETRSRNFALRGGGSSGPSGQETAGDPQEGPTTDPVEPSEPPQEPTEPPVEEPTKPPVEEPTAPPVEPTPTEKPTQPDGPATEPPDPGDGASTSAPGSGSTTGPGSEETSGSSEPGSTPENPSAKPTVYTTALQFGDAVAAQDAYERILGWRSDCEGRLKDRDYVLLESGVRVAVEVGGREVGQFAEITYRKRGDAAGFRVFESTGVTRVDDRLMITVSVVSGEDYRVSLNPDGDRETGEPAHPQFALVKAAAKRLGH